MRTLVWFRRDLRLRDHPALYHAAKAGQVVGVFLINTIQWKQHDEAPVKIDFWLRNLRELSSELTHRNIPLLIAHSDTYDDVPEAIASLASRYDCQAVHFNDEYEVNERQRDDAVVQACTDAGLQVNRFTDRVLLPPGEVLTQSDTYYSVFTPFKNAWIKKAQQDSERKPLPIVREQKPLDITPSPVPDAIDGYIASAVDPALWPAGEAYALRRLKYFLDQHSQAYKDKRDSPATDGTSRLSPYLACGVLSPCQCFHAALQANDGQYDTGNNGIATWISELIWREFYQHILIGYPRVSRHQPFRLDTRNIRWNDNDAHFAAWCEGRTGFPIVDAGMRQMNAIGWMHNRVRMITAMFLSKDLLLDWRRGERFFMQHLIDGDFGSNNGGWQWSASTGTDAAPYFRIFNPTSQSKRFDPDGVYIRQWVEELADVQGKDIHDPPPLLREQTGYPQPIIDHAKARETAIAAFEKLR